MENERKDRAVLHSYRVEEDGSLIFVDAVETTGSKCAHVCADAFGSYVFGANYASGSVLVTRSDENGQLTMTDLVQHYGHSIVPVRQDAPRAHAVIQTPDGTGVIVPDLRDGQIGKLQIGQKVGKTGSESQSASCTSRLWRRAPSFRLSPLWAVWISAYRNRKPYLRI